MIQLTDNLTISTIRSGKGDCVHICFIGSSGQPHNIIVDSGPTSSAGEFRNLLTSIIRSGETLDALIITHYDDDHIGGILKACDPGFTEIYFNAYTRHLDLSFQTISKRRQEHCAALIEHIRSAVTLLFWKPWR